MQHGVTQISTRRRLPEFDVMKAIAIYLVIWQHTILYCGYGFDMVDTIPGKFITIVNMPLFMLIVGFFSKSALSKNWLEMLKSKWQSLMLPMCIYCTVQFIIKISGDNALINNDLIGGGKILLSTFIYSYWFIWAIMYSIIWLRIFLFIFKKAQSPLIPCLISLSILLVIPKSIRMPLFINFMAMYVFFIAGVLAKHYGLTEQINRHVRIILPTSIIIYITSFLGFTKEACFYKFYYLHGLEYLAGYSIMLFGGLSAIILLYYIIKSVYDYNILPKLWNTCAIIGQYTLPIYLIQGILCEIAGLLKISEPNLYIIFGASILVFTLLCWVCICLSHHTWTAKYLLGKTK